MTQKEAMAKKKEIMSFHFHEGEGEKKKWA